MLRTLAQATALCSALVICSPTPSAPQSQSEADARKAIATFCEQPLSSEGRAAVRTLLNFAEASDRVLITTSPEFTPWIREDKTYDHSSLLTGAYIAGNVLSQLDSGVRGNDPYSGIIQVFRVYRHLKSKAAPFEVAEIEDLLEIHRRGELGDRFAEIAKKRKNRKGEEK